MDKIDSLDLRVDYGGMSPGRRNSIRFIVLKTHLSLALAGALFLLILSVTGTFMAFEHDIERWIDPALWRAVPGDRMLAQAELIRIAEHTFTAARVVQLQIDRRPDVVEVMEMTDNSVVYISPWDGTIRGHTSGPSRTQKFIGYVHQLHLRLVPDPRSAPRWVSDMGKIIVSTAGFLLFLLVSTGLILWSRARRASIKWSASWGRISFDAHQTVGIYAALFLLIAAFTGVMVGFDFAEQLIYKGMGSDHPNRVRPPQSGEAAGRPSITVDRAREAARQAVPGESIGIVQLPRNARGVFTVLMNTPGDYSSDSPIFESVFVDQYSGEVLHIQNLFAESPGYRMVRLNRAIHTGDILGMPGHVITSLSSLLLGVMVITGLVIWWKKLASRT